MKKSDFDVQVDYLSFNSKKNYNKIKFLSFLAFFLLFVSFLFVIGVLFFDLDSYFLDFAIAFDLFVLFIGSYVRSISSE